MRGAPSLHEVVLLLQVVEDDGFGLPAEGVVHGEVDGGWFLVILRLEVVILARLSADGARALDRAESAGSVAAVVLLAAHLAEDAGDVAVGEDSHKVLVWSRCHCVDEDECVGDVYRF